MSKEGGGGGHAETRLDLRYSQPGALNSAARTQTCHLAGAQGLAWRGRTSTAHSAQRTAQRMCTLPLRAAHRLVRSGDCHSYVSPRRGLKGLPSRRACVHGARSSAQSGGQGVSMCMCMCMGCA